MNSTGIRMMAAVLVSLTAGIMVARNGSASSASHTPMTLHVIEHAITDTTVDLGPKGDSLGDEIAFGNPIFNAVNKKQIGHDQWTCFRAIVGKSYECIWTVALAGGQITVEGPFNDASDSVMAITGGTGVYEGARGQMLLHARDSKGSAFDFTYQLQ
jgi:allene oxide cyclase